MAMIAQILSPASASPIVAVVAIVFGIALLGAGIYWLASWIISRND